MLPITAIILCSMMNYDTSPRCTAPPDYFVVNQDGSSWGALTSGVTFTQSNVSNELGVRLQRFQLEDYHHFVSDKGVIEAETATEALSVYLSL